MAMPVDKGKWMNKSPHLGVPQSSSNPNPPISGILTNEVPNGPIDLSRQQHGCLTPAWFPNFPMLGMTPLSPQGNTPGPEQFFPGTPQSFLGPLPPFGMGYQNQGGMPQQVWYNNGLPPSPILSPQPFLSSGYFNNDPGHLQFNFEPLSFPSMPYHPTSSTIYGNNYGSNNGGGGLVGAMNQYPLQLYNHQEQELGFGLAAQVVKREPGPSGRRKNRGWRWTRCKFCFKNGETKQFYSSHNVKDREGKTTCPILMSYKCEICGGTGDQGHTTSHCPTLSKEERQERKNACKTLYNSLNSVGRERRNFQSRKSKQ